MSISTGNVGIVTDNLQLYYSALSLRSFRGEATTNLVLNGNFATGDTSWLYNGAADTYSYPTTFRGKTCMYANGMDNATARGYIYQSVTVTSGQSYTLSFKYFLVSGSVKVEISNAASSVITSTTTGRWITHKATVTTSGTTLTVSVLGNSASAYSYYYITDIQVENKAYATPYVNGSRSANTTAGGGGLLDLSGKTNNADLNSGYVQFDTDGYYFNQANLGCSVTAASTSELYTLTNHNHTYECWVKLLGSGGANGIIFGRSGFHAGIYQSGATTVNAYTYYSDNTNASAGNATVGTNAFFHIALTVDVTNSSMRVFINGVQTSNTTLTKALKQYTSVYIIGAADATFYCNARVPICRAYNKALSAAEVLQNYKAQKSLFP